MPRPDSALPVAYSTILPLSFISNVFFPSTTAPSWLRSLADVFPLSLVAKSAEALFLPSTRGWPMTGGQLAVVLAWTGGATLLTAVSFRWQPEPGAAVDFGAWRIHGRP